MLPKNIPGFIVLLIALCSVSCGQAGEDKIYDLTFATDTYSVREGLSKSITITGGSKDYTVTSDNEEILTATASFISEIGFGNIVVNGQQKGSAIVTVKDNINGQQKKLNIVVTDMYLGFNIGRCQTDVQITDTTHKAEIEKDIKAKRLLNDSFLFYLLKNEEKNLYIFQSKEEMWENKLLYQGKYEFRVSPESLSLYFSFQNGETTEECEYKLSSLSPNALSCLNFVFELGLENLPTKSNQVQPLLITLTKDHTDEYVPLYPKLEKALTIFTAKISAATDEDLPLGLVQ